MGKKKFRIVDKYIVLDPYPKGFGYEASDLSDIFCKGTMSGWVEPFPILGAQMHAGLTMASNGDIVLLFADILSDLRGGNSFSITRSFDNGRNWQTPGKFPEFPTRKGSNIHMTGMMTISSGNILCVASTYNVLSWKYRNMEDYREKTGKQFLRKNQGLHILRSTDDGHTWKSRRFPSIQYEIFPYGKIIELKNGTLLLSTNGHRHNDTQYRSGVLRSDDKGETWKFHTIAYPGDETAVTELPDGRILGLNRAGVPGVTDRNLSRHISEDGGKTWSEHEVTVMSDWSESVYTTGFPLLHRSPSGTLLLLYRIYYWKGRNKGVFAGPALSYSEDDGKTWKGTLMLEDPKGITEYRINIGGWDIINLPDGRMLVLFSLIHQSKYTVANIIEERP